MTNAVIHHTLDNPIIAALGGDSIPISIDENTLTVGGQARLTSFAGGLPLAPGDTVRVDALSVVQEVVAMKPLWIIELYCRQPTTLIAPGAHDPASWSIDCMDDTAWAAAELMADEVLRQAEVAGVTCVRSTSLTVTIAVEDRNWFDTWVKTSSHINCYRYLRTPGDEVINLAQELLIYGLDDDEMIFP